MAASRTLHVRCATWEQVEVFHTRKLRRGKLLSMKVPFQAEVTNEVTLGLELPNGVVIAIDGVVQKASPIDGDAKTWIEVELIGLTDDVLGRIKSFAADAVESLPLRTRAPQPTVSPPIAEPQAPELTLATDERQLFAQLTAELRRLRGLPVHEVLDVTPEADADEIRRGWMRLVRRYHPDVVARFGSPAIAHLAEELTVLCNRAYDRLRAALVAEGRATAVGPALHQPAGWLVGFEDIASSNPRRVVRASGADGASAGPPLAEPAAATPGAPKGGEAFEMRARAMLGEGDPSNAQEVLAAALCVYPRSRPLRSLYYVASALSALDKGELMLATSQLETALAHHEQCTEAAQILEHLRRHGNGRVEDVRRIFL